MSTQQRIAAVTPYWQQLTQQQRVLAMTVDLATLRQRARQLIENPQPQAGMQERLALPAEAVHHSVQGAKSDHAQGCLGFASGVVALECVSLIQRTYEGQHAHSSPALCSYSFIHSCSLQQQRLTSLALRFLANIKQCVLGEQQRQHHGRRCEVPSRQRDRADLPNIPL